MKLRGHYVPRYLGLSVLVWSIAQLVRQRGSPHKTSLADSELPTSSSRDKKRRNKYCGALISAAPSRWWALDHSTTVQVPLEAPLLRWNNAGAWCYMVPGAGAGRTYIGPVKKE